MLTQCSCIHLQHRKTCLWKSSIDTVHTTCVTQCLWLYHSDLSPLLLLILWKQGLSPCTATSPTYTNLPTLVACLVILHIKVLEYAHFVVLGLIISNSTSAHLVRLPRDQWYRRYIKIMTLTFKTTIQILHNTAYDDVPPNQIWLQKDQQFSRHGRNSHTWLH